MFFPERILSIAPGDRVLEVGPGGSPHPRADVLLERLFDSQAEAEEQRGRTPGIRTDKEIVFFDGKTFPFKDKEFDYVICSHVLEHVDDVDDFVREMVRVARKGYLEYPLIYYEYLYNFSVHINLLKLNDGTLCWIRKSDTQLHSFSEVQKFFYQSLAAGNSALIDQLHEFFFEGFEWRGALETERLYDVDRFCRYDFQLPPGLGTANGNSLARKVLHMLKRFWRRHP